MQEEEYYPCVYCNSPAVFVCGNCQEAHYCKMEHQQLDWRKHSLSCKSMAQRRQEMKESIASSKSTAFDLISRDRRLTAVNEMKESIAAQTKFL